MAPETFNLAEAARYLKLGYEATQALFEQGILPGVSLNQKHTVFLRADLDAWIHETARRQAEERRCGVLPTDRAVASPRARRTRRGMPKPDLDANERRTG